ncbi:hypothetical protein ATANTOWER_022084 [Ataeniobius toweri]|uniref:Uncharacterized protein n=1 Tax=Ataeniobius toweri TaxID=208326 RepID=A0ABU7BK35_9TELE|nr:hypothetical protein [Ataeniobius toweri]
MLRVKECKQAGSVEGKRLSRQRGGRTAKSIACSHHAVTRESHQSTTPVGATDPGAGPPSDPNPGTLQMPQTQTLTCIGNNAPQDETKGPPPPLGEADQRSPES